MSVACELAGSIVPVPSSYAAPRKDHVLPDAAERALLTSGFARTSMDQMDQIAEYGALTLPTGTARDDASAATEAANDAKADPNARRAPG